VVFSQKNHFFVTFTLKGKKISNFLFCPKKNPTDSAIFLMKFCHLATKIKEPTTFAKGFSEK
jgi:hypothetical protein